MQAPPAIVQEAEQQPDLLAQIVADAKAKAAKEAKGQKPLDGIAPKSKDSKFQNIARILVTAIGAGMDIDSTNKAMKVPGLVEKNSWLYGKRPSLGRLMVTKAALNAPMLWAAHKIAEKSGKTEAFMPVAISAAKQGLAGGLNYQLIKKQKRLNEEGK